MCTRLLLLALALSCANALVIGRLGSPRMQLAPAPTKTKTFQTTDGGGGGKGGSGPAAVVAKPQRKAHVEETPKWKVILLGDEGYEEEPVCEALVRVIPEVKGEAKQKYMEAQKTGKSLLVVVPFEHAELYQEQLAREDPMIFADLEEE